MSELKPCPFCGGNAEIRALWIPKKGDPNKEIASHKYVRCSRCFAQTYEFPTKNWTGENAADYAIKAWNRRAGNDG